MYAPSFPVETRPPYPFVSSGERINLSSYVVINIENKFSHLLLCNWLYLNFSKGKKLSPSSLLPFKNNLSSSLVVIIYVSHFYLTVLHDLFFNLKIRELNLDIEK